MKETFTIGGITFDTRLAVVVVLITTLTMVDWYGHRVTPEKAYDRLLFYFIIPMGVILLWWREPASAYGWQWGNWREGLLWTVGAMVGMSLILWVVARWPSMQGYYLPRAPENVGRLLWLAGVDLFAWEFVWRGFMLFTLARIMGPGPAIFIQAIPFAYMHLGKPEIETFSTIFGGAAFGFLAWRTQSFVYPWLIHWYIMCFTVLMAMGRLG
ncbi:MAG TPA: CPBP family intramembrane glutamic endopeptidase [Anaerolineae bacterium]|nr:CPBP family intramembrane glutamic endopeptidase [Anaerolineae bacterium]